MIVKQHRAVREELAVEEVRERDREREKLHGAGRKKEEKWGK